MTLATDRVDRDNLALEDELIRKMNRLESEVQAWMTEATALHSTVDAGDKQHVLDLRTQLIAKLTTAVAV